MNAEELFSGLRLDSLSSGHHHCRSGWIQLRNCPFCHSQNYHLGYNKAKQFFSCWKCGFHPAGKVLYALGASRELVQEYFKNRSREFHLEPQRPRGKLVEPKGRGPLEPCHEEYLQERGFNPKTLVSLWELEGIGLSTYLSWRIYIPVIVNGERVSWTTRTVGRKNPRRYISAKESEESIPHKHCLYGIDWACHSIVIVEGPADVWRIGPGAVGLFGTAYTIQQVKTLSRFPYRYILFDNEPRAQEQAQRLANDLSCFPGKTTILQCEAKDPGSMDTGELSQLRRLTGITCSV